MATRKMTASSRNVCVENSPGKITSRSVCHNLVGHRTQQWQRSREETRARTLKSWDYGDGFSLGCGVAMTKRLIMSEIVLRMRMADVQTSERRLNVGGGGGAGRVVAAVCARASLPLSMRHRRFCDIG